jgi:hypothetical protein
MVQFVLEQPPPRFQVSANASVPLSRGKGGRGCGDHTPVNVLICSPFPPWKGGEGDRTRRNSCLNSPSPLLGKGPGVRALFLKIFAGHHTRAKRRIPDPFLCHSERVRMNPLPPAEALSVAEGEESRFLSFVYSTGRCGLIHLAPVRMSRPRHWLPASPAFLRERPRLARVRGTFTGEEAGRRSRR